VHNGLVKIAPTLLLGAVLALLAPATALAQTPTVPTDQQPPPTTTTPAPPPTPPATPPPADGKGSIGVAGGISEAGHKYVAAGQRVRLSGTVKPAIAGQKIIVELFRGSKKIDRKIATLSATGNFALIFRVKAKGSYVVKARHKSTAELSRFTFKRQGFEALGGSVGPGSGKTKIKLVQDGLSRLGYVTSRGGSWDAALGRAVLAFRKTNRMARNSAVSKQVFSLLLSGHGGFALKYPNAGHHVEADLGRQVLVLADQGKVQRIYHMSSGKPSTPTVVGSFRFYRKSPGTNAKGMVFSSYFIRGYAIHGYHEVPNYNASHGCLRVPIPNAVSIFNWVRLGDQIFVYR
jgi:hypothetical protein